MRQNKRHNSGNRSQSQLAKRAPYVKTDSEITLIEKACRIVADTLTLVGKYMTPGTITREIDQIAEDYIRSKGAKPAFKGYRVDNMVFPNTLCMSIDEEVVHGIPSDRKLEDGMIISVDCGAEKNGFFGDSAMTFAIGKISEEKNRLMSVTDEALACGIRMAVEGGKLYDVSRAIQERAEADGFSLTRELVGHGIGRKLHEEPPIPNFVPPLLYRKRYPNVKLVSGMAMAIEPMVHAGKKEVLTLEDGWTIVTADRSPAAHFEHTIIVDGGEPKILTLRN